MSQGKQLPINGVHEGPSVPPQEAHQPNHQCSLLNTLINFIIIFVIVSFIIALVLSTILRCSQPEVHVEKASLTHFNLSNGANLQYKMALEVSVRNPKRRISVQYDVLDARAYYAGYRFGYLLLPAFYLEKENTTTLFPVFDGQSLMISLGDHVVQVFNREKNDGFFSIDVVICARAVFNAGSYRTKRYRSEFKCRLWVPLVANESLGNGFTRTECDVDMWYWY